MVVEVVAPGTLVGVVVEAGAVVVVDAGAVEVGTGPRWAMATESYGAESWEAHAAARAATAAIHAAGRRTPPV